MEREKKRSNIVHVRKCNPHLQGGEPRVLRWVSVLIKMMKTNLALYGSRIGMFCMLENVNLSPYIHPSVGGKKISVALKSSKINTWYPGVNLHFSTVDSPTAMTEVMEKLSLNIFNLWSPAHSTLVTLCTAVKWSNSFGRRGEIWPWQIKNKERLLLVIQILVCSSTVFTPRMENFRNSLETHGCSCLLSISFTSRRDCMQSKPKLSQWEIQFMGVTLFS